MQLIIKQFCTFNLRALILNKMNCHCKKKKLNSTTIDVLAFYGTEEEDSRVHQNTLLVTKGFLPMSC